MLVPLCTLVLRHITRQNDSRHAITPPPVSKSGSSSLQFPQQIRMPVKQTE
jgi:hypothetical protein